MAEHHPASVTTDASWQNTWGSREFIEQWANKGGWQAPIRETQTAMVLFGRSSTLLAASVDS